MHQQVGRKRTVQYGCTLNYFACSNFHLLRVPILTIDSRYQVPSISNINSDSDTKRTSGSLAKWAHWRRRGGGRELRRGHVRLRGIPRRFEGLGPRRGWALYLSAVCAMHLQPHAGNRHQNSAVCAVYLECMRTCVRARRPGDYTTYTAYSN